MKYQATCDFEGVLTMAQDEVRELDPHELIVKDLVRAGLLKAYKKEDKADEGSK